MKIAISCGGTGGHVFPGLATAEALVDRGHDVFVLSTGREVESTALRGWSGIVECIGLANYGRSCLPVRGLMLGGAFVRSLKVLRGTAPSVLLAMGGYSSICPVLAARILGVPVVLHEGNAVPGRALKFLSRFASAIAVNYESSARLFEGLTASSTGFPVRRSLINAAKNKLEDGGVFTILVLGGSQGSQFLNERVPEILKALDTKGRRIDVLHVAGDPAKDATAQLYASAGLESSVSGFVQDMSPLYAAADLAICRSGASVCAELAVFGIPAILVPYPLASDDHQKANAEHYADGGGVKIVEQASFDNAAVKNMLELVISSEVEQEKMRNGMLACARIDAAENLADIVESVGGKADADI